MCFAAARFADNAQRAPGTLKVAFSSALTTRHQANHVLERISGHRVIFLQVRQVQRFAHHALGVTLGNTMSAGGVHSAGLMVSAKWQRTKGTVGGLMQLRALILATILAIVAAWGKDAARRTVAGAAAR